MRIKILPPVTGVSDGVSRYVASLVASLRALGVEIVTAGDDYDVLHLLTAHRYDSEWREAKRRGRKLVVTVHDLIPEHFNLKGPQYAGVSERREILTAADSVIAVSQYTKDDIIATYDIPASKIHVVHNGVTAVQPSAFNLQPSTYILWVGRRVGYKNFFWFVRAVAPLLWRTGWRVVCTGGQVFGRKERLLIGLLGLSRRFEVVQADEAKMAQLYRGAICLVMPSKMEGFGLPVVEAMTYGCPVVIPRAHVFPEVAGDSAIYFDPENGRMMRQKVIQCVDPVARKGFAARGRERVRKFSWEKCAEQVWDVYVRA